MLHSWQRNTSSREDIILAGIWDSNLKRLVIADPVDRSAKDNLLTITFTLATFVFDRAANQDWLRKRFYMDLDLIRDTEIYQIIMQEGFEKGIQQGLEKSMQQGLEKGVQQSNQQEVQDFQQIILRLFQRDFPELTALATQRLGAISDLNLLRNLVLDVTAATSVEQARALLNTTTPNA
jgi:hypothetical protein